MVEGCELLRGEGTHVVEEELESVHGGRRAADAAGGLPEEQALACEFGVKSHGGSCGCELAMRLSW